MGFSWITLVGVGSGTAFGFATKGRESGLTRAYFSINFVPGGFVTKDELKQNVIGTLRERGLTLEQAAPQIGVCKATVWNWSDGRHVPRGKTLEKLERWLANGTAQPTGVAGK